MSAPELTFTVHPRPESEDPHMIVDAIPAAHAADAEPRPRIPVNEVAAQVGDDRKWDSFRGNLHFLLRYAFGRY